MLRLIPTLFRYGLAFLLMWLIVYLLLAPQPKVGTTPGQYVKHAAYSNDESKLLLVTMPNSPFG